MPEMTGRILTEADFGDCMALWESSAPRYLVQNPEYARHSGYEVERAGVYSGNRLRLVVTFDLSRHKGLTIWRSALFAPFGGAVVCPDDAGKSGAAAERFWRDALDALHEAVHPRADRIDVIFQPGATDVRALAWRGWKVRPHYNYYSTWSQAGEWREKMESGARRQERKAIDSGLSFEVQDAIEVMSCGLGDLWRRNAGRQGLHAEFAGNLFRLGTWLSNHQNGFCARVIDKENKVHAAALIGFDAHRVYYLAGASEPELLGSGAPTLLHTGILQEIDRRGLPRVYDWVGANTPSVVRFKRGFGPELELLMAASWTSRKAAMIDAARAVMAKKKLPG